jgi:hypothetical protein
MYLTEYASQECTSYGRALLADLSRGRISHRPDDQIDVEHARFDYPDQKL